MKIEAVSFLIGGGAYREVRSIVLVIPMTISLAPLRVGQSNKLYNTYNKMSWVVQHFMILKKKQQCMLVLVKGGNLIVSNPIKEIYQPAQR
jgi:hypothetical protein